MKRIDLELPPRGLLVAVDLSAVSMSAWGQAERLGAAFGVPVEAVYVNEQRPSVTVGDERVELTAALKRRVSHDIHQRVVRKVPVHILEGDPVEALTRLAEKKPGHWLAMGTHARVGLRRLLRLGSVAEALVIGSPVPILTVREAPRRVRSILAPVGADPRSDHGFQYAAELAGLLKASLTPMHVAADKAARAAGAAYAARLVSRLPAPLRRVCAKPVVSVGKVEAQVVAEAAGHDLVVLTADRELMFSELLLGGTAERILRFSSAPVLSLPAGVKSRAAAWRKAFGRA